VKIIDQLITAFAVLLAAFALGYLFMPAQPLSLLGFTTDASGLLFLRFVGSLGLSYAVLIWTTRKADLSVRKPIVLALFVMFLTSFAVVLYQQTTLGFGNLGWFGVVMYGISAGLLGYQYYSYTR
jgi:hypothetical protein